jgi:hypothetical protein
MVEALSADELPCGRELKLKRVGRGMSAHPWKEPAVSPIMATDENRWTLLLQQSQSILWQVICLSEHCDFRLR